MTRSADFDLSLEHRPLVTDILRQNMPPGTRTWVFGSRATGRARRYSDLDLAIDAGRRLTLDDFARLHEAFDDSDLPYKVDIIDWRAIDDRFRQHIAGHRVQLSETMPPERAIDTDRNPPPA